MKKYVYIVVLLFVVIGNAKVDINYKINLLDKNVKNAESNFSKYKENLKISVQNFNEATRIVNNLRSLKKQGVRDTKRSKTNSLVYGQVMEKYTEFVAKEQGKILKEEDAVRKLEALIISIKQNTAQRKGLITKYNTEIDKARVEIDKWRVKQQEVSSVLEDISEREKLALVERKKWNSKKETYKTEAKKWGVEVKKAQRTLATFEGLRK